MSENASSDLYAILGVPRNASPDQIKKAYYKKSLQCHPDKCNGSDADEVTFGDNY
jgi:molecular chaperone DnaJ